MVTFLNSSLSVTAIVITPGLSGSASSQCVMPERSSTTSPVSSSTNDSTSTWEGSSYVALDVDWVDAFAEAFGKGRCRLCAPLWGTSWLTAGLDGATMGGGGEPVTARAGVAKIPIAVVAAARPLRTFRICGRAALRTNFAMLFSSDRIDTVVRYFGGVPTSMTNGENGMKNDGGEGSRLL